MPEGEASTSFPPIPRCSSLIVASLRLALQPLPGMVSLHFLDLPDGRWMTVHGKQPFRQGAGPWTWAQAMALMVGMQFLAPAAGHAQIDPLIYSGVAATPRLTVHLAIASDGTFLADGSLWQSREAGFQVTVEHPLRQDLAFHVALAGSRLTSRLGGAVSENSLDLDRLAIGLAHTAELSLVGDHQVLSLDAFLPLHPSPGAVGYQAEATAVWLHDPLALEVSAALRAVPNRPLALGWSGGVTFLANRQFSLAAQIDLTDTPGEVPAAIGSLTLYRHPTLPGQPMWGWGIRQAIEAGQARTSIHLLWGLGW